MYMYADLLVTVSVSPTDLRAYLLVLPGLVLLRTIYFAIYTLCAHKKDPQHL